MVYLKIFGDKQWVQDSSTTVIYIFYLAVNISLQNVIHVALSLSLPANIFFYWQNDSTASLTPHFLEENEFCNLLLLITGITRTLQSCTFINHSLKYKVVTFAEFWKHICERVNFSKVRGLQPAILVPTSTFRGIFQGFCLFWINSYLTNISQWLFLTKHK